MAALHKEWTVYTADGCGEAHKVVLDRNSITIDGAAPIKISKLKKKYVGVGRMAELNIGGKVAQLYLFGGNDGTVLVLNGRDCETGLPYDEPVWPKWAWIFQGLLLINFFMVLGGALGAVVFFLGSAWISRTVVRGKCSTGVKVLKCLGIVVLIVLLSFVLFFALSPIINKI